MKESDLYEPIKEYFSDLGYSIYAEVEVRKCGGRVDVVAYNHPAAIAIELKKTLSFDLIEQAIKRRAAFPLIYIAYPLKKVYPPGWLLRYLKSEGIGILEVGKSGEVYPILKATYRKPLLKKPADWKSILRPEHQEWVPGGHAGGGYVTNYAITMKGVRHYLSQAKKMGEAHQKAGGSVASISEGWRTVKEILDHCETHYATPKNSLGQALEKFEFDWCDVKREKGRLYFRHK